MRIRSDNSTSELTAVELLSSKYKSILNSIGRAGLNKRELISLNNYACQHDMVDIIDNFGMHKMIYNIDIITAIKNNSFRCLKKLLDMRKPTYRELLSIVLFETHVPEPATKKHGLLRISNIDNGSMDAPWHIICRFCPKIYSCIYDYVYGDMDVISIGDIKTRLASTLKLRTGTVLKLIMRDDDVHTVLPNFIKYEPNSLIELMKKKYDTIKLANKCSLEDCCEKINELYSNSRSNVGL
jgi:hypothetical protein